MSAVVTELENGSRVRVRVGLFAVVDVLLDEDGDGGLVRLYDEHAYGEGIPIEWVLEHLEPMLAGLQEAVARIKARRVEVA